MESLEDDEETKINEESQSRKFDHLVNQKVRAPYKINDQEYFCNAFISIIEEVLDEYDDCIVKVFFLNPLNEKMKVCDHYFDGICNYNEDCKYSHGELILYSRCEPYIAIEYDKLKKNLHVHVKTDDMIWKPGTIVSVDQLETTCEVKMQNGTKSIVNFEDILPPYRSDDDDSSEFSMSDFDDCDEMPSFVRAFVAPNTFGEWEKFTSGFGSKMLQKFGYELGKGLGKNGEGIIEPVQAKIYIPGKSLDFNMNAVERSQRDTVEAKCKRDSAREERRKSKATTSDNVFSIINEVGKIKSKNSKSNVDFKTQSKKELNLNNFKISEDMKKTEKSISKLKETRLRQLKDPKALKNIDLQLQIKEKELNDLKHKQNLLNREQDLRKDNKKLSIF